MNIKINEKWREVKENCTVYSLKNKEFPDSHVIVLNGFPLVEDKELKEGDRVVFIKKGIMPNKEELEELMVSRHTPGIHEKLKSIKVLIAGCGGLGSNIAISLGRIGVGSISLVDFDIVEPSNLNRQQYYIEDIGEFKVTALKRNLIRINPFIKIEALNLKLSEDNMGILQGADIIIEAFDNPDYKALLANYVLSNMKDKFLISSSGMAGFYDSNLIKTKQITDKFYICGDLVNEAKEGCGLMAPRVAICANHMANLVIDIAINKIEFQK